MIKTKEKKLIIKDEKVKETPPLNLEVAAYYHWQQRGCPINDGLTDWVAVENGKRNTKKKK
jgi:hypothetical protein